MHEDRGKRQDHGEVLRQAQAAAENRVVDRAPATQKFYLSMLRTLQALTHTYASHNHIRQHTELKRAPLQADHRDARAAWRALGEWLALSDMLVLERPAKDALELRAHR